MLMGNTTNANNSIIDPFDGNVALHHLGNDATARCSEAAPALLLWWAGSVQSCMCSCLLLSPGAAAPDLLDAPGSGD